MAHNNLGIALAREGKIVEGIRHFRRALQIKPDFAMAHNNLGNALLSRGRIAGAIEHFQQAVQIDPDYAKAHNNLGFALACQGKIVEAIEHYHLALQIRPDFVRAHTNLCIALATAAAAHAKAGRFGEAIKTASKAIDAATAAGNRNLARQIRRRIESYRQGVPYQGPSE
jgi:Flp pilus assembly protein TadD